MSKIIANLDNHTLYVQTLNHPLKSFMSAALNCDPKHRIWPIRYKGIVVGEVRIKNNFKEGDYVYRYSDT